MESVGVLSLLVLSSIFMFNSLNGVYANDEGNALDAFKKKLSSDTTMMLYNWDPTLIDPCTWIYVTCNEQQFVTEIDLGNLGLHGELGSDLAMLSNLKNLYLYNNSLLGDISSDFGNLRDLQILDLSSNGLMGEIPKSLSLLSNLRILRLRDNALSGNIDTAFINNASLVVLDLSSNNIDGPLPEWNDDKKQIFFTAIQLADNLLSGSVPESWNNLIGNNTLVDLTTNPKLTGICTVKKCNGP
ncbi:hypothetical protein CASFOL_027536 [Castilleja foliolosa]|uniref:Leucine-rich repeat-containing N-terminal plant-type domain-containing protein n=1 Tax=Castilleja foliolosa TaxID=1961234 RepID=A0ABD3CF33_9LAMI